jgi:CHAT domain-containing protein
MTQTLNNDNEHILECIEDIYQALLPLHLAVKTKSLPVPLPDQRECIQRFDNAAQALCNAGRGNDNAPFWLFAEFKSKWHNWIEEICNSTETNETTLFLEAVMEALNSVLHHEPVIGIPTDDIVEEEGEGLVFITRTLGKESPAASRGTTMIETALERYTQSRWRYISQLARGNITTFREVADSLQGLSSTAQLQFMITEHGTVVYIIHEIIEREQKSRILPELQGENDLQVFTFPEVTLSSLRQLLIQEENSWFNLYNRRHQKEGFQLWKEAMDHTLQRLYSQLIAPIDSYLKGKGIKHLRIIPHRALHLIPFSALYYTDQKGQQHYLVDDYDIIYAPSATMQQLCKERAGNRISPGSLTAISNPKGDLPFASAEVDQITTHFPASSVKLFCGEEAKCKSVVADAPGSVLHFSGHGKYDWNDPLASQLLLADEPIKLENLFAEEFQLPETGLVVLSACETNITDPEDLADEYLGLASGFLFAGAPTVVSTLWSVDDISTALLIGHFYRKHVKEGYPPRRALQEAQIWLREVVDRPFVSKHIHSLMTDLKKQRKKVSPFSEEENLIDRQLQMLKNRHRELLKDEKHDPGGKPFYHPYYWAAFTVSGADIESSIPKDKNQSKAPISFNKRARAHK